MSVTNPPAIEAGVKSVVTTSSDQSPRMNLPSGAKAGHPTKGVALEHPCRTRQGSSASGSRGVHSV